MSLSAGNIWYTFPQANGPDYYPSTREVFLTAQYNNDIVNPFVKTYYDYKEVKGLYSNFGLNKTMDITDRLSAGSEVSLGAGNASYTAAYFGNDRENSLLDFNAALFASYALTDNVSIGARIAWMQLVDQSVKHNVEDYNNALYYQDSNMLWGGINLAVSF